MDAVLVMTRSMLEIAKPSRCSCGTREMWRCEVNLGCFKELNRKAECQVSVHYGVQLCLQTCACVMRDTSVLWFLAMVPPLSNNRICGP